VWVVNPGGKSVETASDDCSAQVCRTDGTGAPVVLQHHKPVTLATFSPDGSRVATGSRDGLVRMWAVDGVGQPVVLGPAGSYKGSTEVNAVCISPDGARVMSASGPIASCSW